jgi:hypothetical protein
MSSDHNPVVSKLRVRPILTKTDFIWDYSQANWPQFRETLNILLATPPAVRDEAGLETAVHYFTTTIQQTVANTVPKKKFQSRQLVIPPSLRRVLRFRNYILRRYQKTRQPGVATLLSALNKLVPILLRGYQNEKWQAFLRTLHPQDIELWKITRYFKSSPQNVPPLERNGIQIYRAEDKAEALATRCEQVDVLTIPRDPTPHARMVDRSVERFVAQGGHKIARSPPVSIQEVQRVISTTKRRKAPGEDGISTTVLRQLPITALQYLSVLFSSALSLGHFPRCWKLAKVIPILKPKKPPSQLDSYRPISLLSAISKLLERVVARRLAARAKKTQLVPDEQFGFRKKNIQRLLNSRGSRISSPTDTTCANIQEWSP